MSLKMYARSDWRAIEDVNSKLRSKLNTIVHDEIVTRIYEETDFLNQKFIKSEKKAVTKKENELDKILTSRTLGFPIMLLLLGVIIYMTIWGANVPSSMIMQFLFTIEVYLTQLFHWFEAPSWLHGILVLGLFRSIAWVISVMLPPMAIFFPIFALLEDYGYLPRVAFNMDRLFKGAGAHGKQSLTMAMGFGCNAAGVIACRIIESPRERMIAILTNNLVPCNGRWPTLILMAFIFLGALGAAGSSLYATGVVVAIVLVGISFTLLVSWGLSKTVLHGVPSTFTLELPPYRKPAFIKTVVRTFIDKTLFVLRRAIIVAAPAGLITWILANIIIGDTSVLGHTATWLDPFAKVLGLDGYILMAFILGLPANEIVLPILVMSYLAEGAMLEMESVAEFWNLFIIHGWTWLTALNLMLFSLLHYPCGTTLFTIFKETKSIKWTAVSFLLPTMIALIVTFTVTQVVHLFGWV